MIADNLITFYFQIIQYLPPGFLSLLSLVFAYQRSGLDLEGFDLLSDVQSRDRDNAVQCEISQAQSSGESGGREMRQRLLPDWRLDQWMVTVTLTLTHLCNGMCVSLQVSQSIYQKMLRICS